MGEDGAMKMPSFSSPRLPIYLLAALAFAGSLRAEGPPARRAEHVVLVSIDGLRPEFYLDPSFAAPMLRELVARGAHAEAVEGVFPSVTYPSHTTLITGVRPARHGIFYNAPFEPAGATGRWYWEASAIRVPTLFSLARAAGLKSASVGWPVTVGAPIDWNVPEIWSLDPSLDSIERTRQVCQPPDLLAELEREATGRLRKENFYIEHQSHDDKVGTAAAYLLVKYRPNLLAVHLVGTDHFQHEDGRESVRVRRAVASADRAIAQIYEAAEAAGLLEKTTFVIVGDHGHIDCHTRLAPNVALVQAGLRTTAKDRGPWRATFHTAAASAFLHVADPRDHEAVAQARAALAALPASTRALFRLIEREELDRLGAAPEAAFALAPRPGVDFTDAADGQLLSPSKGANHGFLPDEPQMATGFIASGAGIRPGATAARLQMVDLAPLVASLLGFPLPDAEGNAPLGFLLDQKDR
jgi:predicted AlkP superfamily pyrophosphatase or phosphodiesterase